MIDILRITDTPNESMMHIIEGMRNPLESWDKIDSVYDPVTNTFALGPNDKGLMQRLAKAGTDDRKFMRMMHVMLTINAPLYWWKEFDTYKVATTSNSCSTMHKIQAHKFTRDMFSMEHLVDMDTIGTFDEVIGELNSNRDLYLDDPGTDLKKQFWWNMIQLLPSSFNQRRTIDLNYETLAGMYKKRRGHKLDEWREFCKSIESLKYSFLYCEV